jgi:hypothetical protein
MSKSPEGENDETQITLTAFPLSTINYPFSICITNYHEASGTDSEIARPVL